MSDTIRAIAQPAVFPFVCFVVGLAVGSFLNVVIHRLPRSMERAWKDECAELAGTPAAAKAAPYNLFVPRSACPSCGHAITPLENVPILSWAVLRGRCSACRAGISARYPLVELLGGIAAAWSAARLGFTPAAFGAKIGRASCR